MYKYVPVTVAAMVLTGVVAVQAMSGFSRDNSSEGGGVSKDPQSIIAHPEPISPIEHYYAAPGGAPRSGRGNDLDEQRNQGERTAGYAGNLLSGRRSFDDCMATVGARDGSHGCSGLMTGLQANDFSSPNYRNTDSDHTLPPFSENQHGGPFSSGTDTHPPTDEGSTDQTYGRHHYHPDHGHDSNFGSDPGSGAGAGSGNGTGSGIDDGIGSGHDSGSGSGAGSGSGSGLGYGSGAGPGSGAGSGHDSGPDAGSTPGTVPIPSSVLLFGSAFIVLLGIRRKKAVGSGRNKTN